MSREPDEGAGSAAADEPAEVERAEVERAEVESAEVEPAWKRKARLAAIFGDVVPESTSDDRDEQGSGGTSEAWLKRQVPPHHG